MDNKVYVVKCADYAEAPKKLAELMEMMGGIGKFVKPGEKAALKVNLLRAAAPEEAVTTHPAVASTIGKLAKATGADPFIIDSPGAGYRHDEATLKKLYEKTGMYAAAEEAGIPVSEDTTFEETSYPGGRFIKRFEVLTSILKADAVINLCKMKTHSFMYATGAVKNSFGVIHGIHKPGYHAKLQDTNRFAKMLLDLSNFVGPRLSIMDAVVAMEGEGPGMGDPRPVGLLLAAREPLALDVIAGEIMGLNRDNNPVLLAAEEMGQMPNRLDEVRLIGADIDELRIPDYKFPATIFGGAGFGDLNWWQRMMEPLFKDGMSVKPVITRSSCTACGACKEACPMDCIAVIPDEYAEINDKHCIRCYCCHEMCAFESIELKRSLLHRLMNR
ncbi:MAG: DUF362 domain-containing protein [bacterium]|nr:DUF362 domain-containing protein [bacterium]